VTIPDCDLTLNQRLSDLVEDNNLYSGEDDEVTYNVHDEITDSWTTEKELIKRYYTFKSITLVDDNGEVVVKYE
jgi:hypothetical protein